MTNDIKRILILILDSLGVGELPDAEEYGDAGSNTLANTARAVGGLHLPNFESLGLGNILQVKGVEPSKNPQASYCRIAEKSVGKDSTTGHWEMMGVILEKSFPLYPDGFPAEVIDRFVELTGRGILGNKAASGTAIIAELGIEHLLTGKWIVYTSADSVFQVAAHKNIVPLKELYDACRIARNQVMIGEHAVGRVIARPFIGEPGMFQRTPERWDYSLPPPQMTALDYIKGAGHEVFAIGKVHELFNDRGISGYEHTNNNLDGLIKLSSRIKTQGKGVIIANLVDFDMLWGHRNDYLGYANGLIEVDTFLPNIIRELSASDVLAITADHGCDPTTPSTDHSREYVPLLIHGPAIARGLNLGTRSSFADLGATICELLGVQADIAGESFADELFK